MVKNETDKTQEVVLFDAHTHINSEIYTAEQRAEVADKVTNSAVKYAVDPASNLSSTIQSIENAAAYDWCYAAVGYHPHDSRELEEHPEYLDKIRELASSDKVVAIGEIGLDYYYDLSERDVQRRWFREQIRMANDLKMPIVIHSREADQETMDILKEEGAFSRERQSWFEPRKGPDGELLPDSRVLLHCFSQSVEMAKQYVKLGATISICGPVTYKNNRKTQEVVKNIPIEFLTVETDAPYLTPVPHRGKPNISPYVEFVAAKVAELKGISYEEAAAITCANAKHFYNIK